MSSLWVECVGGSWVKTGQGVWTGTGHGDIPCVLQTPVSSLVAVSVASPRAPKWYTIFKVQQNRLKTCATAATQHQTSCSDVGVAY